MRPRVTVLVDANVFYGIRLTSLVMHLAQTQIFRARWTSKIHEEWINSLHLKRGIARDKLERRRQAIDASILDCLVIGFEALEVGLSLPDTNDHHVLAAAVTTGADYILTFNLPDFPQDVLQPFGVSAIHPDVFLSDLADSHAETFAAAVARDFHPYKAPILSFDQYLTDLRKANLVRTATVIEGLGPLI